MEVHQQVWLRRDSSQWGWVPAVIVRKDDGGNNSVNITLVNDSTSQMSDDERDYFAQEPEFTQVIRVDKEQLKSADHDDIKLRNIRSSEFEEDNGGRHSPTSALIRNSRRGASSTTTASTMPAPRIGITMAQAQGSTSLEAHTKSWMTSGTVVSQRHWLSGYS